MSGPTGSVGWPSSRPWWMGRTRSPMPCSPGRTRVPVSWPGRRCDGAVERCGRAPGPGGCCGHRSVPVAGETGSGAPCSLLQPTGPTGGWPPCGWITVRFEPPPTGTGPAQTTRCWSPLRQPCSGSSPHAGSRVDRLVICVPVSGRLPEPTVSQSHRSGRVLGNMVSPLIVGVPTTGTSPSACSRYPRRFDNTGRPPPDRRPSHCSAGHSGRWPGSAGSACT